MKLIDKSALIAEIEKELNTTKKYSTEYVNGKKYVLKKILSFLDTLEVKEVNDEPECKIFPRPIGCYSTCKECPLLTTNNKAQKGDIV